MAALLAAASLILAGCGEAPDTSTVGAPSDPPTAVADAVSPPEPTDIPESTPTPPPPATPTATSTPEPTVTPEPTSTPEPEHAPIDPVTPKFDATVDAYRSDRQVHTEVFGQIAQLGSVPPLLWNDGQVWVDERNIRLCIAVGDSQCASIIEGSGGLSENEVRERTERIGLDPDGPPTDNDPDYLDWKDATLALLDVQTTRTQPSGAEWNLVQELYEATNDRLCEAFDERRCRAVFDSLGVERDGDTLRLTEELDALSADPFAALEGEGITVAEWFEETTELLQDELDLTLASIFFASYNDNLCENLGEYRCRQVFDTIGMPRDGFSDS